MNALLLTAVLSAAPGEYFVRGERVYTMDGAPIENGFVHVRGGKIIDVGVNLALPSGARVVRAKVVMPPLFAAPSTIGLQGVRGNDSVESTAAVTPGIDVIAAIDPFHRAFVNVRAEGVGFALVLPAFSNVLGGSGGVIRTVGTIVGQMVVERRAGFALGFGEVPKAQHAKNGVSSRMGAVAALRGALTAALDHREREAHTARETALKPDPAPAPLPKNLDHEALRPLLARDVPAFVRAQRRDDILTALRLADEFNIRVVIVGGAEAPKVASLLAAKKIGVLYGPLRSVFRTPELTAVSETGPAALARAGVTVGLAPDEGPLYQTSGSRDLLIDAALAVRGGLPVDLALAAITRVPAELAGVGDRVGRIKSGRSADLLLLDGPPFATATRAQSLILNGVVVSGKKSR
ncbi:MAG: amidohydrolase family protein [Deltaproteobacteria bacterium]|nr:amidohydrolase family protein [Deltaproteobacteria bacterium]